MAARAIRRISQPNSRHSACIKIACLNKKDQSPRDCYRLRSSTRASTAARLHSRPKSETPVGVRPHRFRSSRLDPLRRPRLSPVGNPAGRGAKLIHGSAIKTSGKNRRISKLRNSNRR